LTQAATRGDGQIGEDITGNVTDIIGVQQTLPKQVDCEIRGEVVMHKSDLESYNSLYPDDKLSNCRNAASGTLRRKSKKVAARKLHFYAFDLIIDPEGESLASELSSLGFPPTRYKEASGQEVTDYIQEAQDQRENLDYEIDGVVIKIADRETYRQAGNTGHHPRGAVAYKLSAQVVESQALNVHYDVGKTGNVTPVLEINPVLVGGVTITRATLHNPADIKKKDIRLKDRVKIKRAGDVIPFVIGPVDPDARTGEEIRISLPKVCPSCSGPLKEIGNSGILNCTNGDACPSQKKRRLEFFVSRAGADIDALGKKQLAQLLDKNLIKASSDLYTLTEAR
jgi:DNA ligase (NAD+)